nr:hypothetical protein [Amycolatopsis umgeniensis]
MQVAQDGTTWLTSRNGNDFTARFPVLDGEIVALDAYGRPDFGLLQNHAGGEVAVAYFVFDVVLLGDDDLSGEPYEQRRAVLEEIEPPDRVPAPTRPLLLACRMT